MEPLLLLVHRIPYPPNKGDKIRSFNLLKYLAMRYRVHLGAFVDDPDDWRHAPALRELCGELYLVGLHPRWQRLRSLSGLLAGEALSLPYYRHRAMARWVREKRQRDGITRVVAYSSPMAQYVLTGGAGDLHRVVDFVDVDSEKWREYARHRRWPASWVYAREAERLVEFERAVAQAFDASIFVTEAEAALFRRLAPRAQNVVHIENGVDSEFFSPERPYPNPYSRDERVLVFTGAMDYWANIDAVRWFARDVFPRIRAQVAQARFYIAGARPAQSVRALAALAGVRVTGAVSDIRPYLHHAQAAVAPLRVARGVQNKVLEAMAMGKPVLATPAAMDGIRADGAFYRLVSDDPAALASRGIELLAAGDLARLGERGREFCADRYPWARSFSQLDRLLDQFPSPATALREKVG